MPVTVVYEAARDNLEKLAAWLPNIVTITVQERKDVGATTYITSKWQGKSILPDIIGSIIKGPDMGWIDRSEWVNDKHIHNWKCEPFIFKDYISVNGTDIFSEDVEHTKITTHGTINVNFMNYPLIPTLLKQKINEQISHVISSLIEPNFIAAITAIEKHIRGNKTNL